MDIPESKLLEFESTLREIRDAVLSDTSLFADREFRRAVRILAFGFGVAIAAFCAIGQTVSSASPNSPLPSAMIWAAVAILAIGGVFKLITFSRIMRKKNKTIMNLMRIIYGKSPVSILAAVVIVTAASTVALISRGEGALALSFAAIFIAFGVFALNLRIRLSEFGALGWFLLVGGAASLFVIESAPWIWAGALWTGAFFTLGLASLAQPGAK